MRLDERQNIYYLRLSREDGDIESGNETESNSISSQRVCIRRYIEENGITEAAAVYSMKQLCDVDISNKLAVSSK